MRNFGIVLIVGAAVVLSGCETSGPKQQSGAALGVLGGALIGSQFGGSGRAQLAGGIIGAVAGGIIGGSIGAQMDARDRARLKEITTASIRSGKTRSFRNSKTGVRATATVVNTSSANGKLCRTVQQNVTLANGQVSKDTVSGCKGPNGWSV